MKIFVIGPLGLPAQAGGLSKHTEEISAALALRGHEVTVATRNRYTTASDGYRGIRLLRLPVPALRGLETLVYGCMATLAGLRARVDVVHYQGIAAATFAPLSKLRRGRRIVLTVHSSDWAFDKWNPAIKWLLRTTERLAVRFADLVIAVSDSLADGLRERYPGRSVHVIVNGIDPPADGGEAMVRAFNLEPGGYVLTVGRLVPEKGTHTLIAAKLGLPLVVVGSARHSTRYDRDLQHGAPDSVRFLGFQSGDGLGALYAHAAAFLTASESEGGWPMTVLEAMSFGLPVVASDIAAHREALNDTGYLFSTPEELEQAAASALTPAGRRSGELGRERLLALGRLGWDGASARTAELLEAL